MRNVHRRTIRDYGGMLHNMQLDDEITIRIKQVDDDLEDIRKGESRLENILSLFAKTMEENFRMKEKIASLENGSHHSETIEKLQHIIESMKEEKENLIRQINEKQIWRNKINSGLGADAYKKETYD